MPAKRATTLYTYLKSDSEWEHFVSGTAGLLVVEIYAEWCGICKAVYSIFKRFKQEHGSDVQFAGAESDNIPILEAYRGRCEPIFLLYAGGVLVGVVHGPRGPQLEEKITDLLGKEKRLAAGEGVRIEVVDTEILKSRQDESGLERIERGDASSPTEREEQEVTVAVIKPDMVRAGKVDEILGEIEEKGIEVIAKQELVLTEAFVQELYAHLCDQPQFPDLVAFMTGGASVCLALTQPRQNGPGIVEEFREIIGPYDVELARAEAPSSLRAKYGTDALCNAIHASSTREQAARELAFCFPKLAAGGKSGETQRTLALIRLEALKRDKEELLCQIREAGFEVACTKEIRMSEEQVSKVCEQDGRVREYLRKYMTDTPVLALCLSREDAVQGWLEMIGGGGADVKEKEVTPQGSNAPLPSFVDSLSGEHTSDEVFYGSSLVTEVESELDLFFPVEQTVAVIKPNAMQQKEKVLMRIEEAGFHIAMQKEALLTQELVGELYQDKSGSEFYDSLQDFMCSGPSLLLVLSKRDAVSNWRNLIGPVNPIQAQKIAPNCLRAIFGEDILANGLHGCSSSERVEDLIKVMFEEKSEPESN